MRTATPRSHTSLRVQPSLTGVNRCRIIATTLTPPSLHLPLFLPLHYASTLPPFPPTLPFLHVLLLFFSHLFTLSIVQLDTLPVLHQPLANYSSAALFPPSIHPLFSPHLTRLFSSLPCIIPLISRGACNTAVVYNMSVVITDSLAMQHQQ